MSLCELNLSNYITIHMIKYYIILISDRFYYFKINNYSTMIKKKTNFQEDIKITKKINNNILNQCRTEEKEKKYSNISKEVNNIVPIRGRQLNTRNSPIMKKKENSTTCESKGRLVYNNKSSGNNNKSNQKITKSRKIEQHEEEEYLSSESDYSMNKKRIRKDYKCVYENEHINNNKYNKNLHNELQKRILDSSIEISSSEEEENDDILFAYQEGFINQIEKILVDIINNHINLNSKKIDRSKLENDVDKYEQLVNIFINN
jgi:hypothetical protein